MSHHTEHDNEFKNVIPEPRPRKKSTSVDPDEALDVPPPALFVAPVPKTRAKNAIAFLRTPSSFLSKGSTNFSRSVSVGEPESGSLDGYKRSSLQSYVDFPIGNGDGLKNGNNNADKQKSHTNESSNGNGNTGESLTDGIFLSKSDSKPAFEARSFSVDECATKSKSALVDQDEFGQSRKTKMTVADRLKMFQSNSHSAPKSSIADDVVNGPTEIGRVEKDNTTEVLKQSAGPALRKEGEKVNQVFNTKQKLESEKIVVAPIAKPERKITPPFQVTPIGKQSPPLAKPAAKRINTVFGQVSKYRNFKAAPVHKKFHIENLRNISTTCPSESELIQANAERVAVPLNTPGGKIAVFELNRPGRQADGVISALVHGTKVMDFMFDPFDSRRLVVGCDDGRICIWKIPTGGLKEQTNEPESTIAAHAEKVYFVRFHPLAKDILASGSYDLTIRIWNLSTQEEVILIQLHPDQVQIFSFCWSPCGSKFATACKDGKLRVYEPRATLDAIAEGKGPTGVRGGRVCWALEGKYVIVAGFDRSSERQILMYNAHDLSHVSTVSLDVSPSILVPFYDEDSSILLLSGRGDSTIFAFDVIEESPYLRQLSNHRCPGAHQGVAFLRKNACEIQNVEFARALRLTEVAVEPWAFIVPRVKSEFFQDDLFPPTKILWEPCMTCDEWLSGANIEPQRMSLKPDNMKSVGEISSGSSTRVDSVENQKSNIGKGVTGTRPVVNVVTNPFSLVDKSAIKKQQDDLEQAMKEKLPINMKLEQDSMEGVDEIEWNE